jgi:hypothetical protein
VIDKVQEVGVGRGGNRRTSSTSQHHLSEQSSTTTLPHKNVTCVGRPAART